MASSSSYLSRKTPGVYVTEYEAFGNSIVGVETAVPCFVGYTQTAVDPVTTKPAYLKAVEVNSLADYYDAFGVGFHTLFYVDLADAGLGSASLSGTPPYDFQAAYTEDLGSSSSQTIVTNNYVVTQGSASGSAASMFEESSTPQFNLFNAIRLFYANGGGKCYVISVANYWGTQEIVPTTDIPTTVNVDDLNKGLDVAMNTTGPTMLVVPDACLLTATSTTQVGGTDVTTGAGSDYAKIVSRMITDSAGQQDRVAILDMPGAVNPSTWTAEGLASAQGVFEQAISDVPDEATFSYGTAYAPALQVSVLGLNDVDFTNLYGGTADGSGAYPGITLMNNLLTTQANTQYAAGSANLKQVLSMVDMAFPADGSRPDLTASQVSSTNKFLTNALPLMKQVLQILLEKLNVAPPSGVMAGIWTLNDQTRGVWNAPANYVPSSVVAPKVILTDLQQQDYNVPLSGNSIGILRYFPSRGTTVWGARTLDGNSDDYRYIQVRRTLNYIEQSIKQAIQPFVFAPNVGSTWVTVTSLISNFLTGLWQQGGLMGDKASDAFTVQCGLGSTMTAQNVLDGYMIVSVKLQMVRPAEYIELKFTQMMQGS